MDIALYDLQIIMEMDFRKVLYMWILITIEVDRLLKVYVYKVIEGFGRIR